MTATDATRSLYTDREHTQTNGRTSLMLTHQLESSGSSKDKSGGGSILYDAVATGMTRSPSAAGAVADAVGELASRTWSASSNV